MDVPGTSPLYVASQNNDHVDRFQDVQGTGYCSLGSAGAGDLEFDRPTDVVVARIPKTGED